MTRNLLLPTLLTFVTAPSLAIDYGSTTLHYATTPEVSLQRYVQLLCARTTGRPLANPDEPGEYRHFTCAADGEARGDVFARFHEGRLEINYRLPRNDRSDG